MRTLQYGLFCFLVIFIVWRGIIPAFTHLDTDFPNYYTASRLLLEGKDISRIYDDAWFLQQTNLYGMEFGRFNPFPPATIFIMAPFAWAPPLRALQLWTALNVILLAISVYLLMKITRKDWLWCSLIMLSSGIGLVNNFRFGQFYLILALLVMLLWYGWEKRQPYISGVALGIGAVVKYLPVIYFFNLAARKEWKTIIAGFVTIVLLIGAGIWALGVEAHREFVMNVFFRHLDGNIRGQSAFSATFQTWDSMLRRLFVYDAAENPSPAWIVSAAYIVAKWIIIAAVAALTFLGYKRSGVVWGDRAKQIQFALISIAAFVLLPAAATYHFLLLALPVALLLTVQSPWSTAQKLILVFYMAIAFMPYAIFRGFEGKGILTLLAYPRLWCVTALFGVSVQMCVWRRNRV